MQYKKEVVKKDGRHLLRGGPRDMQQRQHQQMMDYSDQSEIIGVLKSEISNLKSELSNHPTSRGAGEFTAEQVDDEINKAVEASIKELSVDHGKVVTEFKKKIVHLDQDNIHLKQKVELSKKDHAMTLREVELKGSTTTDKLKARVESQQEQLDSKDVIIKELKTTLAEGLTGVVPEVIDLDRPQMEAVLIDPLEKDAGSNLEMYVSVEDVSTDEKEVMEDKVSKLRNILGKLPKK